MTRVFFVRHAQPDHDWEHDESRPLTSEGERDAKQVLAFFKNKSIDAFYSSPYKRSFETIKETAHFFDMKIRTDARLRERQKGKTGNTKGMFQKRWADKDYREEGGESIHMVQSRNILVLKEILNMHPNDSVVIGTHGTALSCIMNYYDPAFNCNSFLRIIDWMPYIVELDFEKNKLIQVIEHLHIEKEFAGEARADK